MGLSWLMCHLDSAASAQKPRAVLDAIQGFYDSGYANIHRGVYQLSAEATEKYEGVRDTVARFLGQPLQLESALFYPVADRNCSFSSKFWISC